MHILKRNLQIRNGLFVSLSDLEDIILVLTSKKKQNSQHPAHFLGGKFSEKGTSEEKKARYTWDLLSSMGEDSVHY